jgi:hypothetical protein
MDIRLPSFSLNQAIFSRPFTPQAVANCSADFRKLARKIAEVCDIYLAS